MANEVVQKGTAVMVGAMGMVWTGYLITDATIRNGFVGATDSRDYNGNPRGHQFAGRYTEITLVAEIDDPADDTEVIDFDPGDIVTITFPTGLGGAGVAVEGIWQPGVETRMLQGDTNKVLLAGTMRKEDAIDYTP